MDKYDSIDKIPSVADAMEIAENEGRPVCAPTSYRTCEDCGELFEASGKARYCPECKRARQIAGLRDRKIDCEICGRTFHPKATYDKICPECKADKEKVEEWKKAQGLLVVQAAKENGAEVTNERVHFPALAEERRRKRQPVTVDLTNFLPKKKEEKAMETTTAEISSGTRDPESDIIAIAKNVANLCEVVGMDVYDLCSAIESFATGFVSLRRKNNA